MSKHPLAGKPCPPELRTDIPKLIRSYFTTKVDPADPAQKVSFGTSGHRGSSLKGTFQEDHIAAIVQEKGFDRAPCVLCSRLRRGKLYGLAQELNCNKLALGQHLDDIVSSMLISLCRGQGLTTMAPRVQPDDPAHPAVIRPLALIPESLIVEYSATLTLPRTGICRYREQLQQGDRAYFKGVIESLSEYIPDLRSNIAHSLGKVEIDHLLVVPPPEEKTP